MPAHDNRVRLGARSCVDLFRSDHMCVAESVHDVSSYLLAKFLVLLYLFASDVVKSPHDWLNAQLNGFDATISGTHITAVTVFLFTSL